MMKTSIIFVLILLSHVVVSQDLRAVSVYHGDSISVKWLPNNFEQFKLISEGAKVSRAEVDGETKNEDLNYSEGQVWKVGPVKERYDKLTVGDDKFKALLDPLFESATTEEQENFAFGTALIENVVSPDFQHILGNIIVDKDIEKKKLYVYKIEVEGLDPIYLFGSSMTETTYKSIDDLEIDLDQRKTVELKWMPGLYTPDYFGYDIEHSVDKISKGVFLNETPFLPFTSDQQIDKSKVEFRDNPEPGHFHFYRLHGRNAFGRRTGTSEWKKIYVPLLVNAAAQIDTVYADNDKRHINGSIYNWSDRPSIEYVSLMRSVERDGEYVEVERRKYADSLVGFTLEEEKTGDHYYYKIVLSNKDDEVSSTPKYLFTLDQEPPSPPSNITGTIDSSGVVLLNWTQPEDDDIRGYRVFRANSKTEEFIEKTTRLDERPQFNDTLRLDNLTSEVYYTIQSVDLNMNQSAQSDTILILKPDTIAPIPAVINSIEMQDSVLKINWTNSDSDDLKVNYLVKYFKSRTDTLFSWTGTATNFMDTSVSGGNYYNYGIITFDQSLNRSEAKPMTQYYEPGYRKPLHSFKSKVDMKKKVVLLSWDPPSEEVYSYQIFRGKGDEKVLPLKTIPNGEITSFEDRNVRINNRYVYTIKYITQNGIHSIPARLEVIYQ